MNRYEIVAQIPVTKNGSQQMVDINYIEAFSVNKLKQGELVTKFAPDIKRKPQTIYNTLNTLKKKLNVKSHSQLVDKCGHLDFDKLLAWLFVILTTTSDFQLDFFDFAEIGFG